MEQLQTSTVDDVILSRRGYCIKGTLLLSTYHLVFTFYPNPQDSNPREIWICYPVIEKIHKHRGSSLLANKNNAFNSPNNFNSKDSSLAKSYQDKQFDHYSASHIRIQCKDFTFYSFDFVNDLICKEVYQKLSKFITLPKVTKDLRSFYAFNYQSNMLESNLSQKGWKIYDPIKEYERLGLISSDESFWRLTTLNEDYKLCPSYPNTIIVPGPISDNVVKHASKFRSKQRIPAIVYKHKLNVNGNVIARCAQPLVGLNIQNRSIQDEKLIGEIFKSQERERLSKIDEENGFVEQPQRNLIVDLRPLTNAMAQHALGAGTENIDNYKGKPNNENGTNDNEPIRHVDKIFCNIDNIHVMRDSLNKLTSALNELDDFPVSLNADNEQMSYPALQQALSKSQWLHRLSIILQSVDRISKSVHLNNTNVIIHCSDGWDRTSQVSALLQLCLDPYYRTLEGFMILIEKEWLSFGFKFNLRADHGGCIGATIPRVNQENEFDETTDASARGVASFLQRAANKAAVHLKNTATAAANAASAASNNMNSSNINSSTPSSSNFNPNEEGLENSISETESIESNDHKFLHSKTYNGSNDKSPIFHQFIDCVFQIYRQHPSMFEFNSRFLKRLFYHYYSCQYGTFLCDSERALKQERIPQLTTSVWDYFNSRPNEFINPNYDDSKQEVVFFNYSDVKWWTELYGRSDEELNGLSNSLDRKFAKMNLQKKSKNQDE